MTMSSSTIASLIWKIKNFDLSPNECLHSPKLNIGLYKFCLDLHPFGYTKPANISFCLRKLNNFGAEKVVLKYQISIVSSSKERFMYKTDKIVWRRRQGSGWTQLIERDELLMKKSVLLPDNTLTLRYDILSFSEEDIDAQAVDQDTEILSNDLAKIFENGQYSDIVLVAEGRRFNLHRVILECRGKEFTRHVKKGRQANEYLLEDIKASDLQLILHYLYSGAFDVANTNKVLMGVLQKYHLYDLQHFLLYPYHKTVEATSEIPVSKLSFRWLISDFSKLQDGEELVYSACCITEYEWSDVEIILTKKELDDGSNEMMIKFDKLMDIGFIRCIIHLWSSGSLATKTYEQHLDDKDCESVVFQAFDKCLYGDILGMVFDISMSRRISDTEISKIDNVSVWTKIQSVHNGVIKNLKGLQKDCEEVYRACNDQWTSVCKVKELADVVLCAGGRTFHAHRVFLGARSPVFAKMFNNDFLNTEIATVMIKDVPSPIIACLLQYIYCGRISVSLNSEEMMQLYKAADKYELLSLKEKCANFLSLPPSFTD